MGNKLLVGRRELIKFSIFLSTFLLGACSTDSRSNDSDNSTKKNDHNIEEVDERTKITVTSYDVLVERSAPILNATVIDSKGKIAIEKGHSLYRFKELPTYPIYVFSGVVNFSDNKVTSLGDLKNNLMLGTAKGGLITILTSLAAHEEKREWLKNSFELSDKDIDEGLPRFNKKLAAISDTLFEYCSKHDQIKPSKIPLLKLQEMQKDILGKIDSYSKSDKNSILLEKELASSLKQELVQKEDIEKFAHGSTNPKIVINQLPKYELNDEDRYALAFMWHEERLAGDTYWAFHATLYDKLNDKEKKLADRVLKTIEYSERLHQELVEALIEKYDVDILHIDDYDRHYSKEELKSLSIGTYPIKKLQTLWDNVAPIGTKNLISALRIGCIAEIGDIEDLNRYIEASSEAIDIRYAYEFLKAGSILHYWAFDKALKELGVQDGACSISSRYCKKEGDFALNGDGGTHISLLEWVEEK